MNDLKIILAILVTFAMLYLVLLGVVSGMSAIECSQVGKVLNYKTEWHYWTGCVVEKPDGSHVLLKQIRNMER